MKTRHQRPRHARRTGFTMLELMIGVALSALMILAVAHTAERSTEAYRQARTRSELEMRAHRVLNGIAAPLADASRSGMSPDPAFPDSTLTFSRLTGFAGGVASWGDAVTIEWQLETGELADGTDNNGNGLVDEGVIVRIDDPGQPDERESVLAHGVRALEFSAAGNVLSIDLTLEELDRNGRLMTTSAETSVGVRN